MKVKVLRRKAGIFCRRMVKGGLDDMTVLEQLQKDIEDGHPGEYGEAGERSIEAAYFFRADCGRSNDSCDENSGREL